VAKALAKDPTERYGSAGELARAFRDAMLPRAVAPVVSEPPSPAPLPSVSANNVALTSGPDSGGSWLDCPDCGASLPFGAGICPSCKFMIPLDQLPKSTVSRTRIERREVIVNLLPQSIRWTPDGLQLARRLAAEALRGATVDGWEPTSFGEPYRLVEGRTIAGSVVESAVLKLERMA
jgi:hypothetical protein